jgi:hypothetical protein
VQVGIASPICNQLWYEIAKFVCNAEIRLPKSSHRGGYSLANLGGSLPFSSRSPINAGAPAIAMLRCGDRGIGEGH